MFLGCHGKEVPRFFPLAIMPLILSLPYSNLVSDTLSLVTYALEGLRDTIVGLCSAHLGAYTLPPRIVTISFQNYPLWFANKK